MPLASVFYLTLFFALLSFVIRVILSFGVRRGKDSNLLIENCFISQVPLSVIYIKGFTKSNPTITISNPRFVNVALVRRYSDSLVIYVEIKIMHRKGNACVGKF